MKTDALQETIFQSISPGPRTIAKATRDHIHLHTRFIQMSTHRRRAAPTLSHFQTREVIGVDDMVLLTTDASKEAGVVENLRKRLQKEQIYTRHILGPTNDYQ